LYNLINEYNKGEMVMETNVAQKPESKFTGGLLGLIGITLLQLLLTVITLGIAFPFAVCIKESWIAKHTIIDGHRLTFDGNGLQLWGKYIIWLLLTVITCGIYGLWLGIKMKKWVVSHTHMVY
jgi:uncharacterized membrane protein YjgN (DUF898 family)